MATATFTLEPVPPFRLDPNERESLDDGAAMAHLAEEGHVDADPKIDA
ncbi:MAG: hypothetical protein NT049_13490 [Planctomycetota bacterium]|nr:hypothetical protein [Planctomycetota bacterium]